MQDTDINDGHGPLFIGLVSACSILGVDEATAPKDSDFPPIIRFGGPRGKRFVEKRRLERYIEGKLGRPVRLPSSAA